MLPDQTSLKDEVATDIQRVRDAYDTALGKVSGSPAEGAITGLKANIDDWAAKGEAAVKTPNKAPYPTGWSGWTNAGATFLNGISDIVDIGQHVTLDAITATVVKIPEETVKQVKHAAHAVKANVQAAVSGATSAVSGVAKNAAMAAGAVLLLLIVLKKAL